MQTFLYRSEFEFHGNRPVNETHFHMNGFAQRHRGKKTAPKWRVHFFSDPACKLSTRLTSNPVKMLMASVTVIRTDVKSLFRYEVFW